MTEVSSTSRMIDALLALQCDIQPDLLADVFGECQREHLWARWERVDGNVLYFWSGLDAANRITLERFIASRY